MAVKIKYGPSVVDGVEGNQFIGKTIGQVREALESVLGIDQKSPARIKYSDDDEGVPASSHDIIPDNCTVEFAGYANMKKG